MSTYTCPLSKDPGLFREASVKVAHSRVHGYGNRPLTLFFKGFCFAPNVFVHNLRHDNYVSDVTGFELGPPPVFGSPISRIAEARMALP